MDRGRHASLSDRPAPDIHGHMPALDGVRGLAILMVIYHHFQILRPLGQLEEVFSLAADLGKHGVDLFFALSGFLITGILLDSRDKPHYFRNFYARRTLRIFPLYYAILAFFLVIVPIFLAGNSVMHLEANRWNYEARYWPWYVTYLSNILFVKHNGFAPAGLDITWTLAIEEQFYVMWAVAIFFLKPKQVVKVCFFLIFAAFLFRVGMCLQGASWVQVYGNTPSRLDGLAVGALPAALMRSPGYDRGRFLKVVEWVTAIAAAGLAILVPRWFLAGESRVQLMPGITLVALTAAGSIMLLLHARAGHPARRFFENGGMRSIGKYSYAMYLFHVPIRDALKKAWFTTDLISRQSGVSLVGLQMLFLVVGVVAVYVAAVVSWYVFERHWLGLKKFFPSGHAAEPALQKSPS